MCGKKVLSKLNEFRYGEKQIVNKFFYSTIFGMIFVIQRKRVHISIFDISLVDCSIEFFDRIE